MKINIAGQEWYPMWTPGDEGGALYEVPDELVERVTAAHAELARVQQELRLIVDPPCPDCGHPGSRHQFSAQGNHAQEPGTTLCLFRDPRTCGCTTPQQPNPNLAKET